MSFEIVYGLSHPEALYPYQVFLVGGVLKNVRLPDELTVIYVDLLHLLMTVLIISTALLFVFRFSQTVDGRLNEVMSNPRKIIPIVLGLIVFVGATVILPLHLDVRSHSDIEQDFIGNDGVLQLIQGQNIFAFKVWVRAGV